MSLSAVIKIGGSLSRGNGLESLCREVSRLGERYRLFIVPGGGGFADQVRDAYTRFGLNETTAHHMALLAMDQYGLLLHDLIAGSYLTEDVPLGCSAAESGRSAIWLPSALLLQEDPLPHSWRVTSDSISAWVARKLRCDTLILLKDVDGLMAATDSKGGGATPIAELTVEQLGRHSGGVDEYLAHFLAAEPQETWVINGLHPARLEAVLEKSHASGTRIRRS